MTVTLKRSRQADRQGGAAPRAAAPRAGAPRAGARRFSLTQVAWPLYVTYPLAWCVVSYAVAGRFTVTGEFLTYAAIVPACQTLLVWTMLRLGRRFFQP
jgi:hypothetical protein